MGPMCMTSSPGRLPAKVRGCIHRLLRRTAILLPVLLAACQSPTSGDRRATSNPPTDAFEVLEVAAARYHPTPSTTANAAEGAECKAWALDARQAAAFFRLSRPLGEGELHDFAWLPCSIDGRLRMEGREWAFEINAAGTSIWRSGDEARLLGCDRAECEAYVILMPERTSD